MNLELRPALQSAPLGSSAYVELYAVSADGSDQPFGLVGTVLNWNADTLQLIGRDDSGAPTWSSSGFPSEGEGLNNTFADGDAYYQAIVAQGGPLAVATAAGTLVTTFQFEAISATGGEASVSMAACVGATCTRVLDRHPFTGGVTEITGSFDVAASVLVQCASPADCDDDNACTDDACGLDELCINVPNDGNDPDDGLFCNGVETCSAGSVVVAPGTIPDCADGLTCTSDTCQESPQECNNTLQPGFCLINDVCYADGALNPTNDCEVCDSDENNAGWSARPLGDFCGDATESTCNHADMCDGFGACADNFEPPGTACGSAANTVCTAPDSCNGSGACLANHEPNGTTCDDGLFCTLTDECLVGTCIGTGSACVGQTCDETTDSCKRADLALVAPSVGPFAVGETVAVELYIVSGTGADQPVGGVSAILGWDPPLLELVGNVNNGPYSWFLSELPDDSQLDGLNDSLTDGNALYVASALAVPAIASTQGLLATTFEFRVLSPGNVTIQIIASYGSATHTRVLDGYTLGFEITGSFDQSAAATLVQCLVDAHCDDDNVCNGSESCADMVCLPGSTLNCDDGLFCDGAESCVAGVGCVSVGNPCPAPESCDDAADNCGGCDAPTVSADGARYLVITPRPHPGPVALRISGVDDIGSDSWCIEGYVQDSQSIGTDPVFKDPASWGTVGLTGVDIVPSTRYIVQTDCRYQGDGYLSEPVEVTTWMWGDVNNDGDVQIDDISLAFDASQGTFPDGTSVANFDLAPCAPDGAVTSADVGSVQSAYNGLPYACTSSCDLCASILPPLSEPGGVAKNRYLSFRSGEPGEPTGVRVVLESLPEPFDVHNGKILWVGPPVEVSEVGGVIDGNLPPTFFAAGLQCAPHYEDWTEHGTIHVSHELIVPGGVYLLQSVREGCPIDDSRSLSAVYTLINSTVGDVCGSFNASEGDWAAPDDSIDLVTDMVAVMEKFSSRPGAPIKSRADLDPAVPDRIINITDALIVIDAFRGLSYPFVPGPFPCPE